jgi:hypothetical protein
MGPKVANCFEYSNANGLMVAPTMKTNCVSTNTMSIATTVGYSRIDGWLQRGELVQCVRHIELVV